MRARIALALFVLFALLSSAYSAAAQSSPIPSQPPRESAVKPKSAAKPLELSLVTQVASLPHQVGSANGPAILLQGLETWPLILENRKDGLATKMQRFGASPDAPKCAHIRIIQAPDMDSEMIVEAAPGEGGPILTFQGLPPCRRDLPAPMTVQRFYGAPPMLPVPPRIPFVQPPVSQIPSGQPRPAQPKPEATDTKP